MWNWVCQDKSGPCQRASGMCGIFKLILMLQNKWIPASLNFQAPSMNIDFINSPVYVVNQGMPLQPKGDKTLVGINGFGMSGTNAHIILQEALATPSISHANTHDPVLLYHIRQIKTAFFLVEEYARYLHSHPKVDIQNFCYILNTGRSPIPTVWLSSYKIATLFAPCLKELLEKALNPSATDLYRDAFAGSMPLYRKSKTEKITISNLQPRSTIN